jgi:two-component system chemotaxis sensor kinase CheA
VDERRPNRPIGDDDAFHPEGEVDSLDANADGTAPLVVEIDPELVEIFVGETIENLGSIEASVLALDESQDDSDARDEVFRLFHTVKGSAGALGFSHIQALAHVLEDLLDRARAGRHQMGRREVELVLAAVDLLANLVRDIQKRPPADTIDDRASQRFAIQNAVAQLLGEPASEQLAPDVREPLDVDWRHTDSIASTTANPSLLQPTINVNTKKLDTLVDLVGELVIAQSMILQHARLLGTADDRLSRTLAQCQRLTHDVHQSAMTMRLVPIRRTFQRMQRLVRDLSWKSGKDVDLTLSGEETELDRKVVDEIAAPLMHMLRNSIDHGIEDPESRRRAGKTRRGQLAISASHQSGAVHIEVSDDGRGLDTDALYERGVARGLVEPSTRPSEAELHALIFRTGFSTAERVTEISGRGVGMDVVRRAVESLRGRIEIRSRRGEGTTFLIKLPLTLATIEGLLLAAGGQRFVLPTFAVQESLRPSSDRLRVIPGHGWIIEVRNQSVPVVSLADLFKMPAPPADPSAGVLVVVEDDGRRLALLVDELLGKQGLVIKSLGETFANIEGVAGGAILGDGRIGLILDAGGLIRLSERVRPWRAA